MTLLNPELRRNLWLELSLHRLIAAPIVVGLVLTMLWSQMSDDLDLFVKVADGFFLLLVVLWGTRRTAAALVDEIEGRTWDGQRLSALGAWAMTWGKLIGATVFVWYCALPFLAAVTIALARTKSLAEILDHLLFSLAFALFVQSAAFLASLALLRRAGRAARGLVTVSQLFGIGLGLAFMQLLGDRGFSNPDPLLDAVLDAVASNIVWYGLTPDRVFVLASLFVFLGWFLLGCYRLMRVELQYRTRAWAWVGFLLFVIVYGAGFAPKPDSLFPAHLWNPMLPPALLLIALVYLGLFTEPRSWDRRRALFDGFSRRRSTRLSHGPPLWLLSYLVLAIVLLVLYALSPIADAPSPGSNRYFDTDPPFGFVPGLQEAGFLVALLLFVLRDALLVQLLSVGEVGRRADLAALVYLVCLYGLSGAFILELNLPEAVPIFYPSTEANPLIAVGPVALQILLLVVLIGRRRRGPVPTKRPAP